MRVTEVTDLPHLPFIGVWLAGGALAAYWNSPVARHLIGVAALGWLVTIFIGTIDRYHVNPISPIVGSAALLLGCSLAMANLRSDPLRALGVTLSTYASFALAIVLAPVGFEDYLSHARNAPDWAVFCGLAGIVLTFAAAAVSRRIGHAFAGLALLLATIVANGW